MDKSRQKYLQQWLRKQQQPIKKYLNLNILLASLSSVILVAQTYLLASLLHKLIMLNESATDLIPYFCRVGYRFCLTCIYLMVAGKNRL